ncbi:MAG: valine--tRNA ligase [Candidatus Pacebacteria bacterium]|nr:valine--tRNA ligase [Candidatus Paceibacterota bacterium]
MELSKAYDPKQVEDKIYKLWQESGFFNPDYLPGKRKKSYTIVVPPPNITGVLHMGHALNLTVQDILIRWKRLQGFKTLWLPGTDHAGIATQNVVEKELKKEGLSRFDLGKEKFIERVWQWKEKYGNIILEQFKKMGSSMDWSRTRFTMDEGYTLAVKAAFLHYYEKGLIYRGKRVVNWCPRCQTSLSDLEIEFKEEKGKLWYIRYPIDQKSNIKNQKYVTVATTRPETMLGDMAVAVNPKDERYKNLVGQNVVLPLVNIEIPIIADRLVDLEFGTGAVKVTPAHDLVDADIGFRHKLGIKQVIDERGKITKDAPLPYQGLSVLEAREKIISDLQNLGLLEKVEDYIHQIPKCYRCNTTIELIPSEQWFLKMSAQGGGLAEMAIKAVKSGKIKFYPKNFEKPYLEWLKNVKDWCISRQIWWGHKIPIEGSEDVLDTWFSSALWPFATLGWPSSAKATEGKAQKNDLQNFYPTDVLSTARDILNLWVSRMIFSGMEFMKKIPFSRVYIHPTVLTKEGKRMSKSLGTGIDPILLIDKYGADATRFGIAFQIMGGQDIKFLEDNIMMGKKFCNKVWNASRFVLFQSGQNKIENAKSAFNSKNLTPADKKILKSLEETIKFIDKSFDSFEFGQAAHRVYEFFWHDFCDSYIEISKKEGGKESKNVLAFVLFSSLKILHPFVPFITEEIYQNFPFKDKQKFLMVENWPK